MKNATPIEQLMNLDDILPEGGSQVMTMQSMDGYPKMPHVNNSYMEQMDQEGSERELSQHKMASKIRKDTKSVSSQYKGPSGMGYEYSPRQYMYNMNNNNPNNSYNMNYNPNSNFNSNPNFQNQMNQMYQMNDYNQVEANNYRLGPKAYKNYQNRASNDYQMITENYENTLSDASSNDNDISIHLQKKSRGLNCIEIAEHIRYCPICSKFYENDKTMYVIVIIILLITCIILLKKVIENYGNGK